MFPSADSSSGRGNKDVIQEVNRKGVEMYAYNPSTTEAETRGSEVQGQPEVKSETVSKTQMNKGKNI